MLKEIWIELMSVDGTEEDQHQMHLIKISTFSTYYLLLSSVN